MIKIFLHLHLSEGHPLGRADKVSHALLLKHSLHDIPRHRHRHRHDTSDTRDFLKLFLWQAERHADILATILARMLARMSV